MDCLVFDLDANSISIYIPEINIHQLIKLKDDLRVESTVHFEQEMMVACTFKKALECAEGLSSFMDRRKGREPENNCLENVCFKIQDKLKVRVDTTTEFPLDLKCSLMLTRDDQLEMELLTENHPPDLQNAFQAEHDDGEV